jgi:hypothetical protein
MVDRGPHFWKCVYVSCLFALLYTPFMCVQNIMTTIQDKAGFGDLGFTLLAILYGT